MTPDPILQESPALAAPALEPSLPDSNTLPPQLEALRASLWKQWNPVTNDEQSTLLIYAHLRYQYERLLAAETIAMEKALSSPNDPEKLSNWKFLCLKATTKERQVARALKQLNQFVCNRLIATQISEEFNKEVPPNTPFVQIHTPASLQKVVNVYTIGVAAVFPEFDPKPVIEENQSNKPTKRNKKE